MTFFMFFYFLEFSTLTNCGLYYTRLDGWSNGAYFEYFHFFEFSTPTNSGFYYTGREGESVGTYLTYFHFLEFSTPTICIFSLSWILTPTNHCLYSPKESSFELTVWIPLVWMAFLTFVYFLEFSIPTNRSLYYTGREEGKHRAYLVYLHFFEF